MSDAVTALNGAVYQDGIAAIQEAGVQGMITLRGDLSSEAIKKAVKAGTGLAVPAQRACSMQGETGVAWMSPDELLLLVPYGDVADCLAKIHKALSKAHGLAVNVSDARAMFHVQGAAADQVLAKLCPVDFSADGLGPNTIRRTRMAQVPAAVWKSGENTYSVICFRSQARYVFDLLRVAAQPGSEISAV